ncbi:MAG: hypothetical protein AAGI91_12895 [Bacteroidota bacterium]
MPQFNFHRQFAADVEAGTKRQTVRARRKHTPRVGQVAHCFTGLRTTSSRLLGRFPITGVRPIFIFVCGTILLGETGAEKVLEGTVEELSADAADSFARLDGFETAAEFVEWIREHHGLPFKGHVTVWDPEG